MIHFCSCLVCKIFHTSAGHCHTELFTVRSLGDTWIKPISVDQIKHSTPYQKSLSKQDHVFAHRWTSVCNLRVDKDSTPGVCSMRKIKQISKTAFIFPQFVWSLPWTHVLVLLWCRFCRSWMEITHSGKRKNNTGSSSMLRILLTRQPCGVKERTRKSATQWKKSPSENP